MVDSPSEVTALLQLAKEGNAHADSKLFKLVEQKLHAMAERRLTNEDPGASMQATVLVHDAFLQLTGAEQEIQWNDRNHFYVLAARAMRRILIDRARRRKALKRGGPNRRESQFRIDAVRDRSMGTDVLALHEALKRLEKIDPRQAQVVELRHFGGYTLEETAEMLEVSPSTVKQDFSLAKAWLYREINRK